MCPSKGSQTPSRHPKHLGQASLPQPLSCWGQSDLQDAPALSVAPQSAQREECWGESGQGR